eukprot:1668343-Karenia_brevis.AAC.1
MPTVRDSKYCIAKLASFETRPGHRFVLLAGDLVDAFNSIHLDDARQTAHIYLVLEFGPLVA